MAALSIAYPPELGVRDDLLDAHRGAWSAIASPGTWWTGAERVAIANEARAARTCSLCETRKAELMWASVDGEHDSVSDLPASAIEAVHRIITDSGRLSREWVESLYTADFNTARYVELVGVVVKLVTVDVFHRGIGAPQPNLPEAIDGAPSERTPSSATDLGAWVPMLPGRGPNVARALSLVPAEAKSVRPLAAAQYVPVARLMDVSWSRTLSRSQVELLAAKVSMLHECFY